MSFSLKPPLHRSTLTYVALALLYVGLGIYGLLGGIVPKTFGEGLAADVIINFLSPFILAGGGTVAAVVSTKLKNVPWQAFPFLLALCGLTIVFPGAVLFHLGGWSLVFCAVLYFSKINWFFLLHETDHATKLLFIRGLLGPFIFFAPALIISCLVLGRNTLSVHQTDWVPLFGFIYFTIQGVFEEIMLRRAEQKRSDQYRL